LCCESDKYDSADEAKEHADNRADKPFFKKESFTKETIISAKRF
jgi:hypothetical protein